MINFLSSNLYAIPVLVHSLLVWCDRSDLGFEKKTFVYIVFCHSLSAYLPPTNDVWGNIFTGACLSTEWGGGGSTSRGSAFRGVCLGGGVRQAPLPNQKSRWYTSYWNAFLCLLKFTFKYHNTIA